MKKSILLSLLITICYFGYAQYPLPQSIGADSALVTSKGGLKGRLVVWSFTDTTAANLQRIKDYDGALIKTTTPINALWYRVLDSAKWVQILPTGGGTGGIRAWLDGGNYNVLADGQGNAVFGTLGKNGIKFTTQAIPRFILDSAGILSETGSTIGIGYDPSNGNRLTQYSGGGGGGNYLDSFWRVSGIDSNYYRINGVTYAVLDSTGGGGTGWSLTGNAGTTAGTNFIGTTDNVDVVFKRNSIEGMRLQSGALGVTGNINLTATTSSATGIIFKGSNRFIHDFALAGTNGDNTFIGNQSGNFSMTGSSGSLGSYNVGVGAATLLSNTTGYRNTAIGTYALQNNTTGVNNTAVGQNASYSNTTGYNNTTMGIRAGAFGSGHDIVAYGVDAVSRNNNGIFTVGVGTDAFYNNWDGQYGVAVGDSTFWLDSTGFKNTAIGSRAGYYLGGNYATLHDSLVTFLGADASRDNSVSSTVALNNLTVIGYNAKGFASNQVVLGNDNVTTTLLKGNVGIGTTTPDSTLHVVGGFKLVNGTQGNGKVLTSDANGGASWQTAGSSGVTSVTASSPLASSGGTTPDISLTGIVPVTNGGTGYSTYDTTALASFGGGSGAAGDTAVFSTSAIYGSFFNSGYDTLYITRIQVGLQGTSPSVAVKVWYNDSLNVTAGGTALVTAGNTCTNIYTGTSITTFDNYKIPPGMWVWVKTSTVTTKPTYFTLTLIGYKKRV